MPKHTTNKKKPTTKVGGGGVNTKKSRFNLKIAIPVVLLIAALGGFYIFKKSSAATTTRNASQIIGGRTVTKSTGYSYKEITRGQTASIWVTSQEATSSDAVCVKVIGVSGQAEMWIDVTYSYYYRYFYSNSGSKICMRRLDYWDNWTHMRSITVKCPSTCQKVQIEKFEIGTAIAPGSIGGSVY